MAGLGRRTPNDWSHVDSFPLTAETVPAKPAPVVIGVNWYSNFDTPVLKGGRWWIGLDSKNLGSVRGGHCVCLEPGDELGADKKVVTRLQDTPSWYKFYNQGNEGACVGFGTSRLATLLNRKTYDARWLWDQAKIADEWSDTNPGDDNGTSVHAGVKVLHDLGHVAWKSAFSGRNYQERDQETPSILEGVGAYRWATSVSMVQAALQSPSNIRASAVRILNSWGEDYPQRVWMPNETLQRLIAEDGEAGLVTDK